MKVNCEMLKTKCGCEIIKNTREHDECICDKDGENWICADCYNGEYDEEEEEEEEEGLDLLKTKCGCDIIKNTREHDECICDKDGKNWICGDCYNGEYDEQEEE